MTAVGPLSLNIFVPSFPSIERDLGVGLTELQWTLTLYFVFFGVLQLLVGPASDRLGRRPVFFFGFGIFALASVAAALAPTIEILITARVFQALGAATALVVPRAIVQDTHAGADAARAMAFVAMLQSIAPAVAPFLGGLFETWLGWRASFWFLALWAGAMIALCLRALPETRPSTASVLGWDETFVRYGRLLRTPRFLAYTANLSFMVAIFFAFLTAGPTLLQGLYGLSPLYFSWVMVAIGLAFLVGNIISTRLTPIFGIDHLLAAASLLILVAMLILWLAGDAATVWWIIVPMLVYGVGNGVVFPNSIAGATGVDRSIAGAAASFLGVIQFVIGAAATFLIGNIALDTVIPFALFALLAAAVSLIATLPLLVGKRDRAD